MLVRIKLFSTLSFILLLSILISSTSLTIRQINGAPLTLTAISSYDSPTSTNSPVYGSLQGGTKLWLFGTGFDLQTSNNMVKIGDINTCEIIEANYTKIVCIVSPAVSWSEDGKEKNVSIWMYGTQVVCTNCKFYYSYEKTPLLNKLSPRSGVNKDMVSFIGNHRFLAQSLIPAANIYSLKLNSSFCDTSSVTHLVLSDRDQRLHCEVSPQEAGYYHVSEWILGGYALKSSHLKYYSYTGKTNSEYTLRPLIQSISSHTGLSQGNILTIEGTGLSDNATKLQIKAADLPCTVLETSFTKIKCEVGIAPADSTFGKLSYNGAGTQTNGFISGAGFLSRFYNLTYYTQDMLNRLNYSISTFRNSLTNSSLVQDLSSNSIFNSGIKSHLNELEYSFYDNYQLSQLKSNSSLNGSSLIIGGFHRGYFVAPISGVYKFTLVSQVSVNVYMSSTVTGSESVLYTDAFLSYERNISSEVFTGVRVISLDQMTKQTKRVTLSAGASYYMEIYHITPGTNNNNFDKAWSLSVQTVNTDTALSNQVYEIQKIQISATQLPEVFNVTHIGANAGTFTYSKTQTSTKYYIPYNANVDEFKNMTKFILGDYQSTVTLKTFSSNGSVQTVAANIYQYQYTISYFAVRDSNETNTLVINSDTASNTINTTTRPQGTFNKTQNHTTSVTGGTFEISLKDSVLRNKANTSNYQVDINQIESYRNVEEVLKSQYGKYISVDVYKKRGFFPVLVIYFYGFYTDVPQIVTTANISGGASGPPAPVALVTTIREYSTNLLFESVPTQFLITPSSTPSVIVKVNGILSICQQDCSYQISNSNNPLPNLSSNTLAENIITLSLDTNTKTSDIQVTFAGQTCTYAGGDYTAYKCSLPKDSRNNPIIEAGLYYPRVYIKDKGFAKNSASLAPISVTLDIISLTPNSGPLTGGILVIMIGTGFPIDKNKIQIQQCGNKTAQVISVLNNEIKFYSADCTEASNLSAQTKLIYQTNKDTFVFSTNGPSTIKFTSMTPGTSSPVKKGYLSVIGEGFGTDITKIKAWLTLSGIKKYELSVLEIKDTQLKLRLLGGDAGEYKLVLLKTDVGNATITTDGSNKFIYGIFIDSISPTTGSKFGGTTLTITGSNLEPETDLEQIQVKIGKTSKCVVESASSTSITCKTSQLNVNESNLTQDVSVVIDYYGLSSCKDGGSKCNDFTYLNSTYPTISIEDLKSSYKTGDSLVLATSNLNLNLQPKPIIKIGQNTVTFSNTSQKLLIIYPEMMYGKTTLQISDTTGLLGKPIDVFTNYTLISSIINGSTKGNLITILGTGFVPFSNENLTFTVINPSNIKYAIKKYLSTSLQFQIGQCLNEQYISFNFTINNSSYIPRYNCFTNLTVAVTNLSANSVTYSNEQTIQFSHNDSNQNIPSQAYAYLVDSDSNRFGKDIPLKITKVNLTAFNATVSLASGKYKFKFFFAGKGYAESGFTFQVKQSLSPALTIVPTLITSGYAGGSFINIAGTGLNNESVLVIGDKTQAQLDSTKTNSDTQLFYKIPAIINSQTQTEYALFKEIQLSGTPIGDNLASNAFDGSYENPYISLSSTNGYVGLDIGKFRQAVVTQIKYFADYKDISSITGAQISGSNDKLTWTTISTIKTVAYGLNTQKVGSLNLTSSYRYIALRNTANLLKITELQFYGNYISQSLTNLTSNNLTVNFTDGFHNHLGFSSILYNSSLTPVITNISPKYGYIDGGDNLTITGLNFGTDYALMNVQIDGVACTIDTTGFTSTNAFCKTGERNTIPALNSFTASINKNVVVIKADSFLYTSPWSSPLTWIQGKPVEGDTVHIAPNTIIVVDQSTPKLYSILVEGILMIADKDLTLQAEIILSSMGQIIAGTESKPLQSKIQIILTGNYDNDPMSIFGNKVLGCHNCILDIHGVVRSTAWTELDTSSSSAANSFTITLATAVDWAAGEQIVIASSSYDHKQSERRTIASKADSNGKSTLTLTQPLTYTHQSFSKSLSSKDTVTTKVEVGLLTRNIKIKGTYSQNSTKYGAQIVIFAGPSQNKLAAKISNVQISQCGQEVKQRSCVSFIKNGDLTSSYFNNNTISNSYSRGVALRQTQNLNIQWNVGYQITGHNIYFQTGNEKSNIIQNNLMISSLAAPTLSQSEIYPASFFITNPSNTIKFNRAAGSDGSGFHYNFNYPYNKTESYKLALGELSQNNIAHSNMQNGLKIEYYFLLSKENLILNTFKNYQLWKNNDNGVTGDEVSNLAFSGFIILDYGVNGIALYNDKVNCNTSISILDSIIAGNSDTEPIIGKGISTNFGKQRYQSLRFYNFYKNSTIFYLKGYINQTLTHNIKNISFTNVNGTYLSIGASNIINDEDGSLSKLYDAKIRTSATMIKYAPHTVIPDKCTNISTSPTQFTDITVCNSPVPVDFLIICGTARSIRVARLNDNLSNLTLTQNTTNITTYLENYSGGLYTNFVSTFIGGYTYAVWDVFSDNLMSFNLTFSECNAPPAQAILLRFNYSNTIKGFQTVVNKVNRIKATVALNKTTCNYGDYYYESQYMFICISSNGWVSNSTIEIIPVNCTEGIDCPTPIPDDKSYLNCQSTNTAVYWSNTQVWVKGRLPTAGENVTIPTTCNLILDVNDINLNNLIVDGSLTVMDQNTNITAKFIWIRQGVLIAGTAASPFQNNLNIRLSGARTDEGYAIDTNIFWNTYIVVTGRIALYGKTAPTAYTKLASTVKAGATSLSVLSTSGWTVGQTLGISPSFNKFYEYQTVTITAVTNATSITFQPALNFGHYGSLTSLTRSNNQIDMRATVGVLTRSIKFSKADTTSTWGYFVLIYGWSNYSTLHLYGSGVIDGVEFNTGGQPGTGRAALNIVNTNSSKTLNMTVSNSVFTHCTDYCLNIRNVTNLTVNKNFLFEGQKNMVYVERTTNYQFSDNVMIGAKNRTSAPEGTLETISCYNHYLNSDTTLSTITNNYCQGAQGTAFILPFSACDTTSTGYQNNTAGSSNVGFIFSNHGGSRACLTAKYIRAYGCQIGVTANPNATQVKWSNLMLADNKRGMGLRFGGQNQTRNNLLLTDSWIATISRPDCVDCYGSKANTCENTTAFSLLVVSKDTFWDSQNINSTIERIAQPQELDSSAWITNVVFENFRLNYSTFIDTLSSVCKNNSLFEIHPSADSSIANHHFTNTTCVNCHDDSIGYFSPPIEANLGDGGCGDFLCTGRKNYLIIDHDGALFGERGTIIPSNNIFGEFQNCTHNYATNGYECKRDDIGRIQISSVAKDYQSRVIWPVSLTNENTTNATSTINAWKTYQSKRLSRFLSLIEYFTVYNLSFSGQPPTDMLFSLSLSQISGNNSKWAAFKIYFPIPNAISITHSNGSEVDYILASDQQPVTNRTSKCGAHKYFYRNNTVDFITTGDLSCVVRLTLTSSVFVTMRLNIEMSDFFANNGSKKFITLICTFLQIEQNRFKLLGVYSGSTIIDFQLTPTKSALTDSTSVSPNSDYIVTDLKSLAAKLSTASADDIPNLLSTTTDTTVIDESGTIIPSGDGQVPESGELTPAIKGMIVGVVFGSLIVLSLVGFGVLYLYKFAQRMRNPLVNQGNPQNDRTGVNFRNDGSHINMPVTENPINFPKQ